MRLKKIMATSHPSGNRIDLRWENPDPINYPGVRVVRREGTYPTTSEDGDVVVEGVVHRVDTNPTFDVLEGAGMDYRENEKGEGIHYLVDKNNLRSETVYYYSLFPYKEGDPREYKTDPHNRASAMASGPYNMAGQMYDLLPGIYYRYDKVLPKAPPDEMLEEDKQKGQLRRFLDLPGSQLDQIYSFAKSMLDLHNIDKTDGGLLPLLAQWIGWQLDYRKEIATQRNEIGNAPCLYKTIGLIPTVEATVKRHIGWESRTKEFIHNIFLSNYPERLNIWVRQRNGTGGWSEPTKPLSLNFAYEGRPTSVHDADGILWLFYHTLRKGKWNIWYKTYQADQEWSPSQPLTNRMCIDKYPTAVIQGEMIWVFWATYDDTDKLWHINYRTRTGNEWSRIETFMDKERERKKPWAVMDNMDHLWLFWLEREGPNIQWQLKYNRYNGTDWELASPACFPLDGGVDPRVENDPFVLFHPTDATRRLWVFWARKEPAGKPNQTRWSVFYRIKEGIDPNVVSDWSEIRTLLKDNPNHHDREPAGFVNTDDSIELFWSSNRGGSWSIWCRTLDVSTNDWGAPEQITDNPYSQRDPLPLSLDDSTLLIYRSNESLLYISGVYSATETMDSRYAGCTTIDTRNVAKNTLRGKFRDFQAYTYDAGQNGERNEQDWYARDSVGIYLTPDFDDPRHVFRNRKLVENVLKQFLPIQVWPVFIIEPAVYEELIYTDDFPNVKPERHIHESFFDSLTIRTTDECPGIAESHRDTAPDWIWLRSVEIGQTREEDKYTDHHSVDFTTIPIETKFRTWHIGLEEGG